MLNKLKLNISLYVVYLCMGTVNIHTHNVGIYNDDDFRKFWFQALFTKKTTHYV